MFVPGNATPLLLGGIKTLSLAVADAFNVRTAALAAGWDGVEPANVVCTNTGTHRGTSTSGYAFDTDATWPGGSKITLVNNGNLVGKGGAGGAWAPGTSGGTGGDALRMRCSCPWEIVNAGYIVGGGGGGGVGGGKHDASSDAWHNATGGGGPGKGIVAATAGTVSNSSGVVASGGLGGDGGGWSYNYGGNGGGGAGEGLGGGPGNGFGGGGAGAAGTVTAGGDGAPGGGSHYDSEADITYEDGAGANGGALGGGVAITGNSFITWNGTGSRLGTIS